VIRDAKKAPPRIKAGAAATIIVVPRPFFGQILCKQCDRITWRDFTSEGRTTRWVLRMFAQTCARRPFESKTYLVLEVSPRNA
jgi:hypothetical protein